jgi:putative tryptophan/tyrosine transport system substrate-binding protein
LRYRSVEVEARKLGMIIVPLGVRAPDDFEMAFKEMTKTPPDAILMVTDVLTNLNRQRVIDFAAAHRLPSIFEYDSLAHDGGLMAYGPNVDDIFDRAVALADRILHGATAAELPLELPTRFQFAINLRTAKAIGVSIPEASQLRADDLIE